MIFDGASMKICLEASDGDSVEATDIYSRWKDWVSTSDGSKYPEAFTVIGGEEIGSGLKAGAYFFLNTVDGWNIRPREASHSLTISGNIFPVQIGDPVFTTTVGAFQVDVNMVTSSLTQQVSTGGGSSLTVEQIADAVWSRVPHVSTTLTAGELLVNTYTKVRQSISFILGK